MSDALFVSSKDSQNSSILNAINSEGKDLLDSFDAVGYRSRNPVAPNVNVRPEYTWADYELFRPSEAVPKRKKDIIKKAMHIYRFEGLVRNVIDLMSDFATKDIELVHPDPKIQSFYREWAKNIGFKRISERFVNILLRCGNVIIERHDAKIMPQDAKKLYNSLSYRMDESYKKSKVYTEKLVLPFRYKFLNPVSVEVISGELGAYVNQQLLGLRVSSHLVNKIRNPKNKYDVELIKQIPKPVLNNIMDNKTRLLGMMDVASFDSGGSNSITGVIVPLDMDAVSTYYYKKDDWENWADPMITSILDDLITLDKLRRADRAALDGVISQVRLWSLGDISHPGHEMIPTKAMFERLAELLLNNVGGGIIDVIWGPAIKCDIIGTDVHQFLGKSKYEPTLEKIYAGLGMPPLLTGSSGSGGAGGNTNHLSMRTLVERLNYTRDVLQELWDTETERVRQAMGFKKAATVRFNRMILVDEATEKMLLRDAVDRGLISMETFCERYGEDFDLETNRLNNEDGMRSKGELPERASQFYNPQQQEALEKIALQQKLITPKQAGMYLEEDGKTPLAEELINVQREKGQSSGKDSGGLSGQGRPKGVKDGAPRQKRPLETNLSTGARLGSTTLLAMQKLDIISNAITPVYLELKAKKNVRSLTAEDREALDFIKFSILMNIDVTDDSISDKDILSVASSNVSMPKFAKILYDNMQKSYRSTTNNEPSVDELRRMQALVYSFVSEVENS